MFAGVQDFLDPSGLPAAARVAQLVLAGTVALHLTVLRPASARADLMSTADMVHADLASDIRSRRLPGLDPQVAELSRALAMVRRLPRRNMSQSQWWPVGSGNSSLTPEQQARLDGYVHQLEEADRTYCRAVRPWWSLTPSSVPRHGHERPARVVHATKAVPERNLLFDGAVPEEQDPALLMPPATPQLEAPPAPPGFEAPLSREQYAQAAFEQPVQHSAPEQFIPAAHSPQPTTPQPQTVSQAAQTGGQRVGGPARPPGNRTQRKAPARSGTARRRAMTPPIGVALPRTGLMPVGSGIPIDAPTKAKGITLAISRSRGIDPADTGTGQMVELDRGGLSDVISRH